MNSDRVVLHVIDTLWLGGAQQVVKLIMEFERDNPNMHLLVLRKTSEMIFINHPNVHFVDVSFKWDFSKARRELQRLIENLQVDILHCHLPKSQTLGALMKQRFRAMYLVFQEQGDILDPLPTNLPVYRISKKSIAKVICCSAAVQDAVVRRGGVMRLRTMVLHNPLTIPLCSERGRSTSSLCIGFAGRITRHKGWRDFLQAIGLLALKHPNSIFSIHVAGVGPELLKFEKRTKKLPANVKVTMHGMVEKMEVFYDRLDVLVVPSHREPVGMVHIEAMARRVAVIASNVPGMNEVLVNNENAIIVDAHQPVAIASALGELMDVDLRNQLVDKAFKYAEKHIFNEYYQQLLTNYP